ncbi:DUF433 domain-containing protein [Candidatus Marithrix sp. Canyon 246]|uniref:DUF433 domain-containing protein n=1 Tax=Candidatus Marithrix sp. Canyon 246 TaxID=1827136 RepID=UPI0009F44D29|nr:DUF433 domain-containing protein [Candidatus Marithrix sp. Canyon 246]
MATLQLQDINEKVAQAYINSSERQQQRLKLIVEEVILFWTEISPPKASKTETFIQHTPDVCGGNACIRDTRIPVWMLVSLHSQGATDQELLKDYPSLTLMDLKAAWDYYQDHKNEINQAIAVQNDDN